MVNPVGRPRKWKSVEELQNQIEAYFESCFEIDEETGKKKCIRPLTITGLALALDTTRDVLLDYENNEELKQYSNTIKAAKERCHNFAEENLFIGKNTAGVIFNLKNNYKGWHDKQEVEQNNTGNQTLTIKWED